MCGREKSDKDLRRGGSPTLPPGPKARALRGLGVHRLGDEFAEFHDVLFRRIE
jgi:hypothetical protein